VLVAVPVHERLTCARPATQTRGKMERSPAMMPGGFHRPCRGGRYGADLSRRQGRTLSRIAQFEEIPFPTEFEPVAYGSGCRRL
jgi:hypothetical protein